MSDPRRLVRLYSSVDQRVIAHFFADLTLDKSGTRIEVIHTHEPSSLWPIIPIGKPATWLMHEAVPSMWVVDRMSIVGGGTKIEAERMDIAYASHVMPADKWLEARKQGFDV